MTTLRSDAEHGCEKGGYDLKKIFVDQWLPR
jgi:hypothetical protein